MTNHIDNVYLRIFAFSSEFFRILSFVQYIYTFHICIFVATGVEVVAIEDDIKIRNSTPTKEKSYDENLLNLHKMM